SRVLDNDIIFIIVSTPSLPDGKYDHSQVDSVIDKLIQLGRQDKIKDLVICCTTMPEYCDSVQRKLDNYNYRVSYNPEFIAQGTIIYNQQYPDMVLIGEADTKAGEILVNIYSNLVRNKPHYARLSRTEAEICKIALNCFLTTKISYANMVGDVLLKSGFNPEDVLNAIGSDSRVGNKYLKWGYGFGGPCFPRDNRAFAIYAEQIGVDP
ncbi:MAG: hypothetical protein Q8K60_09695, partial [Parachlamydiaceae bacterium]|nr:hypothetical protein [Parachlamydiaceae bacterium]